MEMGVFDGYLSNLEESENSLSLLWTVSWKNQFLLSPEFSGVNKTIAWHVSFIPEIDAYGVVLHFSKNTHKNIVIRCTLNITTTENRTISLCRFGHFDEGYGCMDISKCSKQALKTNGILKIAIQIDTLHCNFGKIVTKDQEMCSSDTDQRNQRFSTTTPENVYDTLLTSQKFSDFIIKVEGHEIAVHKCILATRSSVFCAMLENKFLESSLGYLAITDMDKDTISSFVRYLYTCKVTITDASLAQKLFIVADKYDVQDLKLLCKKYILKNIEASNVVDMLIFADFHNADNIKARAIDYIVENAKAIDHSQLDILGEKAPHLMVKLVRKRKRVRKTLK